MADEPTTEPTPDNTPDPGDAPLGEGGAKALRAEREARKAAEAELRQLRERVAERDRADIATEFGLPDELARRLTGDTPDELRADAERLAAATRTEPVVPASAHQGQGDGPVAFNYDQLADRIVGGDR